MTRFTHSTFCFALLTISLNLQAVYDNIHFYRASNFFYEPRFERDYLTSFSATVGGGSADEARNGCGDKCVRLLDLYGKHNMHQLGIGVPGTDLTNVNDLILLQLANTPARDCFAQFSIGGRFRIVEANFDIAQNLCNGFFLQAHLPVRSLKVNCISFNDLSPRNTLCNPNNNACSNINTPIWQTFLHSFENIMERHTLCIDEFDETNVGDLTFLLGWTTNHQETETLDYIDATIRTGFLAPTSPSTDPNKAFAIPLGYNGHWGFPLGLDVAIGMYEWVTLGLHLDTIIFGKKDRTLRMKTDPNQNGLIKLAKGIAKADQGTAWHTGVYFKADHIVRGFSFILGYSFARQNETTLSPCNTHIFDPNIVNTDTMLNAWKMHTIHLAFEFDFSREEGCVGPYAGIFYNREVGGEHIFKTNIVGGNFGLNIAWDF